MALYKAYIEKMKGIIMKRKVFATIAVFAALALTACGTTTNNGGSGEQKSSATGKSSQTSQHTHVAAENAEWKSNETNHWKECKDGDGGKVNNEEHKFGEWTAKGDAVCGGFAEMERECSVCHYKEAKAGVYNPHTWTVVGDPVAAGDGGIEYKNVKCSKCQTEGIMVDCKKADGTNNMTITGSPKTAPEGCVKLGANGDSMTAVIKLPAAKTGKIFIRGSMDYWYTENNQNEQKGIYNGKSGGGADKDNNKPNFKLEVGADAEHLTEVEPNVAYKDLLYKDWLPEEVGFSSVADTDWSKIGDIEIGNVSLVAGLNTIKFSRTDSYNIAVASFVVAFNK